MKSGASEKKEMLQSRPDETMFLNSPNLCCIVEEVNCCLFILRIGHSMRPFIHEAMGGFKCASLAGVPPTDEAHLLPASMQPQIIVISAALTGVHNENP